MGFSVLLRSKPSKTSNFLDSNKKTIGSSKMRQWKGTKEMFPKVHSACYSGGKIMELYNLGAVGLNKVKPVSRLLWKVMHIYSTHDKNSNSRKAHKMKSKISSHFTFCPPVLHKIKNCTFLVLPESLYTFISILFNQYIARYR